MIDLESLTYVPIQPQADNEELRYRRRLMMAHTREGPSRMHRINFFIAEPDTFHSGWVIGVDVVDRND